MRSVLWRDRTVKSDRTAPGLPFDAEQVLAFGCTVRPPPRQQELVLGKFDQLVEAAGRKFPRSVMNSTTCSRSQASSVMA